ncbi:hypothetical protein JAB9_47100 [Janthinobacterium sp. HH107]|uniref:hypothetical protein n=1 Tax=Janthinobacterium sp. HH107 TaxID=1537279 RepID=UPI00089307B7|nr:hypothetical protein [Janthinobacterium sp. HH107]OEZ92145.1 hypothetical protein JAB9_47100 [Janthinobacterium sp. HH107]
MSLPYENATSGANALDEIGKVLTRFGTMTDNEAGELLVQFSHRGKDVSVKASYRGYAAAWLKAHPHSNRMKANKTHTRRPRWRRPRSASAPSCATGSRAKSRPSKSAF